MTTKDTAPLCGWYTQGGFTDENGKYHHSGYHYELPWWEVLNEADGFRPEVNLNEIGTYVPGDSILRPRI